MSEPAPDERVPLFGNWRNAYLAVVVFFILDVAVFYIFQRYFT
jgi:hypothetical protein